MSYKTRASLPELALGSAVLAGDAAQKLLKRTATAGAQAAQSGRKKAAGQLRAAAEVPLDWASTKAIPKIIDELMPYITETVMPRVLPGLLDAAMPQIEARLLPRLLDAAMPLIQSKVMPVLIQDLTESDDLRELITEQSRDVVADAAGDLRDSTAAADDRLETGFRRLFHVSPAR
jgi:hypothetical protein